MFADPSWAPWNEIIPDGSDWIGPQFDGTLINNSYNNDLSMINVASFNPWYEATEEAVLNALVRNAPMTGRDDHRVPTLPHHALARVAKFSENSMSTVLAP